MGLEAPHLYIFSVIKCNHVIKIRMETDKIEPLITAKHICIVTRCMKVALWTITLMDSFFNSGLFLNCLAI